MSSIKETLSKVCKMQTDENYFDILSEIFDHIDQNENVIKEKLALHVKKIIDEKKE